ncbi:MAG: hypothetical protein ACRCVW_07255 [Brevinema sp.]
MKFFIITLFILLNACSLTPKPISPTEAFCGTGDPEIDMQDFSIGVGNLSIKQKERLYPYFNITIDDITVNDPSINLSREEKIVFLDSLDKIKFILNSIQFRHHLEDKIAKGDCDTTGCTGISMEYDKPVDNSRLAEAVRRFSYHLTIKKSSGMSAVGCAAPVNYYPFYAPPSPLYKRVPHFYVINLDDLAHIKGSIKLNGVYDYAVENPYVYSLEALILHEMLHNMGATHNLYQYQILEGIEVSYREVEQDLLFDQYKPKWDAFKGYHREKFAHIL